MKAWGDDNWDFYETRTGKDDRVIVGIDLEAAKHAPVNSHGMRLQFRIQMLNPREDGLRSAEEAPAMFALEDRMKDALEKVAGAIQVARVVMLGATELIYYIPKGRADSLKGLNAVLGDVAPYQLQWFTQEDTDWSEYDSLYPNVYAMTTIQNRRLQRAMEQANDQLAIPRLVDHVAAFATRDQAEAAGKALAALGYTIDPLSEPEADTPWRLEFHRKDACDGRKPDEFVFEILDTIIPHEGDYDGWGSPVQHR